MKTTAQFGTFASNKLAIYTLDAYRSESIESVEFREIKSQFQENLFDTVDTGFMIRVGLNHDISKNQYLSHIVVAEQKSLSQVLAF